MDELDAAREALEEETASKRQEVAAQEQNFIKHSKTVEDSLKELRERLDAREAQLTKNCARISDPTPRIAFLVLHGVKENDKKFKK